MSFWWSYNPKFVYFNFCVCVCQWCNCVMFEYCSLEMITSRDAQMCAVCWWIATGLIWNCKMEMLNTKQIAIVITAIVLDLFASRASLAPNYCKTGNEVPRAHQLQQAKFRCVCFSLPHWDGQSRLDRRKQTIENSAAAATPLEPLNDSGNGARSTGDSQLYSGNSM